MLLKDSDVLKALALYSACHDTLSDSPQRHVAQVTSYPAADVRRTDVGQPTGADVRRRLGDARLQRADAAGAVPVNPLITLNRRAAP